MALVGLLGACVVEESTAPPAPLESDAQIDVVVVERAEAVEPDVCGLAAVLPGGDVCSLVCDPDAFAARLVDDGMHSGSCYQFRCDLGEGTVVSVGMCLP